MTPTVEKARDYYRSLAMLWANHRCTPPCVLAEPFGLEIESASLAYDLAVAQACEERARRAVAWA